MGAQETINALVSLIQAYGTGANDAAVSALQTLSDVEIPWPSDPTVGYTPITVIQPILGAVPSFNEIGNAPTIASLESIDKPVSPDILEYELGDLLDIKLPDAPEIVIPEIDFVAPEYTIGDPLPWAFEIDDPMGESLIPVIRTRLTNNIVYGGTGLTAAVEDAIWARELERNEQQLQDSTDKTTSMWAKKGFSLPDGLLADSLSVLQREYMNKRIDRAREIAIKQAELEQSNLFKSLELSIRFVSELIGLITRYEELVFRGQEATAKFANEYIDIQLRTYAALVDVYKARAQTYEILVRAEIAKVDVYRAQLEGQKLIGDINEQTVKIYSEQIRSTTVLIERYKSEVDAMVSLLGVEKAKIEVNKIQMDAWAKEADVRIAEYNGKVDLYKASSTIGVSVAELQGKMEESNLQAEIAATKVRVQKYTDIDRSNVLAANAKIEAAKGVAQSASALAAGALAALSAQTQVAYQEAKELE